VHQAIKICPPIPIRNKPSIKNGELANIAHIENSHKDGSSDSTNHAFDLHPLTGFVKWWHVHNVQKHLNFESENKLKYLALLPKCRFLCPQLSPRSLPCPSDRPSKIFVTNVTYMKHYIHVISVSTLNTNTSTHSTKHTTALSFSTHKFQQHSPLTESSVSSSLGHSHSASVGSVSAETMSFL